MNKVFLLIIFTCFFIKGDFQLEVTEGQREPLQMAMVLQTSATSQQENLSKELSKIIHLDLQSTGLFQFSDPSTFLEKSIPLNNRPRFVDWRLIHVQFVINLEISLTNDNKVRISYRLWDALTEQLLISSTLETELRYQRRLAHLVADAIYSRLTGEAGYFDTRIIYVTEEAKGLKQKKRLAIMDQDGKNHKYLTSGEHIVLTPRFSPNLQRITYLSYEKKIPHVYVYDLETGKHDLVGAFPGMTFAPRFGPNEKDLVMSQAVGGRTDIYHIDLNTRRFKKLTHGNWIDTSPCYDPKGEKIVFNSDRGGTKQIYVMDKNGRDVKRISFGSGTYSTPVWSPRGDYIAFTKTDKRNFYIGVMRPDGSGERLIATGYIVEGPTWAPNGRTLMFTRTDKKPGKQANASWVYAIDITGFNERRIKTPQYASDPAWSAPLPKS
ncbi:MAG: Tol-Pal system beta propeller repeat protein TolB [Rickettsiales bacterium]|nr:Tol-Pal system beta propeller repeat protein TolB [Rickettsiales bacterium]|tara:strand:- start:8832 stop:10142 length:1311 start_codon:yes stop_codon:yes gene_type:complete